jgi:hypothetical protein
VTTTFLVIGGIGLFMLVASVVSGAHVHIGHFHLHLPMHVRTHAGGGHVGGHHSGSDTALSLPSIAGFIGAFGFGGAIAAQLLPGRSATLPILIGFGAALPTGWLAARITRAAMEMRTDATPQLGDVVGSLGVVIQAIPANGYGEVRVAFAGQYMKYHARAEQPLAVGARIIVIGAPTETSVLVESVGSLLG